MIIHDMQEDINHNKELIRSYRKSLHVLELQASRFGVYVPPHIQIEIDGLNDQISACEKKINQLESALSTEKERLLELERKRQAELEHQEDSPNISSDIPLIPPLSHIPETGVDIRTGIEIFYQGRFISSVFAKVMCIISTPSQQDSEQVFPLKLNSWTFIPINPNQQTHIVVGIEGAFTKVSLAAKVDCIPRIGEIQKYVYKLPLTNFGDSLLTREE